MQTCQGNVRERFLNRRSVFCGYFKCLFKNFELSMVCEIFVRKKIGAAEENESFHKIEVT